MTRSPTDRRALIRFRQPDRTERPYTIALGDLPSGTAPDSAGCYTWPMPKRPVTPQSSGFILGRTAFDRISAVEGFRRGAASEAMFADFDRRGLGAEERRQAIRARHGVKAAGPTRGRAGG